VLIGVWGDFTELFSRVGRSSVIEPVLAGFRLKGGAKVAELCFEGNSGIIRTVNLEDWNPISYRLPICSSIGCE
jgi:hypothetical protein